MTYKAVDIAREMVRLSIEKELWMTNLKLQKVLYFTWKDYFRENRQHLFEEPFEAWKYGPVVPSVYYEYWTNVASYIFITKNPSVPIDGFTSNFLLKSLEKYKEVPANVLVEESHQDEPWKECYVEGRKEEIPFQMIERSASERSVS